MKTGPNTEPWRTPLVTGYQLDAAPFTATLDPALQPVLSPVKSAPVQAMSSQFHQENAVGNSVKGFSEVQVYNIQSVTFNHWACHLVMEGDWVSQAEPAFHTLMVAVLYVLCDGAKDDLLHDLPWH
ncbi:hypothetical protein BTVI_125734 [Pitangus sulphuratus]|nr:hypothetical protein BTVI_125734 [Pitangus sulphuratus]